MSTRDDQLVGEVETTLDSRDNYILSSPNEPHLMMEIVATGHNYDRLGVLRFTREELTAFIEQCKIYLTNPDY